MTTRMFGVRLVIGAVLGAVLPPEHRLVTAELRPSAM